jgi:hypothetical protein
MYCRICGDENDVKYYPDKRQSLCPSCASDTPRKVGLGVFAKAMFPPDVDEMPPRAIVRDFYEDYLASSQGLLDYVQNR